MNFRVKVILEGMTSQKFGATTLGRGISMRQYMFCDMPKCREIQRSTNQLNAAIFFDIHPAIVICVYYNALVTQKHVELHT